MRIQQSAAKLGTTRLSWIIVAIFAVCALAACGSGDKTPVPAPAQPVVKEPTAPADPTLRMAHAVVSGKAGASVDLKYDVLNKPEPGKPVEIDLAVIPGAVLDAMTLNVSAMPGLTIASNAEGSFGKLAIGEVARHKFSVVADRADVIYLTVTATTYAVGVTATRSFVIPLIVAVPVPAALSTPAASGSAQEKK